MQISDWFTVFTILLAVLALYGESEREILLIKFGKRRAVISALIFLAVVPALIFNPFHILNFQILWLPKSTTYAFVITGALLVYCAAWFFYCSRLVTPIDNLIDWYEKNLPLLEFEKIFALFVKYDFTLFNKGKYHEKYREIICNPEFARKSLEYKPIFFLNAIRSFSMADYLRMELPFFLRNEFLRLAQIEANQKQLSSYNVFMHEANSKKIEDRMLFLIIDCYFDFLVKGIIELTLSDNKYTLINHFPETFSDFTLNIIPPNAMVPGGDDQTPVIHLFKKILSRIKEVIEDAEEKMDNGYPPVRFCEAYSSIIWSVVKDEEKKFSEEFIQEQTRWFLEFMLNKNPKNEKDCIPTERAKIIVDFLSEEENKIEEKLFKNLWENADDEMWACMTPNVDWQAGNRDYFIAQMSVVYDL